MDLVIDNNIVVAAILVESDLLWAIVNPKIMLFAPEYLLEEIEKYKLDFKRRSKYPEEEFELLLNNVFKQIRFIPKAEYKHLEEKATAISPDEKDWPFVALSIELNCPIWTHDRKLLKASAINTITSKQIMQKLEESF